MREDICAIPVNDIFAPKKGCPFCRMRDMLEDRMATYITGAAMMEPDVRVETNRLGFCREHFEHMLARGSRLSVALILESLLAEAHAEVFEKAAANPKKAVLAVKGREKSCFVCESLEKNMRHLTGSMLRLWQDDGEFRELYRGQEFICLSHFAFITEEAQKKLPKKLFQSYYADSLKLSDEYMKSVNADVTHFCRMFDYRNKDADWGNSKDAIERAIEYLVSRKPEAEGKADEKNRAF